MSDAAPREDASLDGSPAVGSPSVHAGRVLAGRYRLERRIAHGGMAEVWEAVDDVLGRKVAVKVLLAHLAEDDSFRERFRREAIAAARLAHPSVVSTFDTGVDGPVTFIVMELIDGHTLRQALDRTGPLPPARAVDIGAQVADALHYAHRAGVVHRDVKPGNILLCPDGRVKVADFGIAKAVEDSEPDRPDPADALTSAGSIVGTAQYLAPEQVEGRPVDGRTDVYSLGVVLYEMLCGRPPYTGGTQMAVALQHVTGTPLAPRQVRGGISRALEEVVQRAMAKRPDDRYRSAADLQTALLSVEPGPTDATHVVSAERWIAPPGSDRTPPRGVPPSFAQTERKWMVPTIAIVAVALTLGVVGVLFARSDTGQRIIKGTVPSEQPAARSRLVPQPSAASFDPPPGDGREHDDELAFLTDGDPSTAWSTEQYIDSHLVRLKPGVGVVLRLDGTYKLDKLKMSSPTRGWAVEVLVSDTIRPTRQAWGAPVAVKRGISAEETTLDLAGRTGSAVLLWITDLGDANNSVSISEVVLTAT